MWNPEDMDEDYVYEAWEIIVEVGYLCYSSWYCPRPRPRNDSVSLPSWLAELVPGWQEEGRGTATEAEPRLPPSAREAVDPGMRPANPQIRPGTDLW